MADLILTIENIKNIAYAKIKIPIEKGIYCFCGTNGSGKSTIISCLGKLIVEYSLDSFKYSDNPNQKITYEYQDSINEIVKVNYEEYSLSVKKGKQIKFKGVYEGSIFYGTRFHDSHQVDNFLKNLKDKDISEASDFVKEKLSYILHGEESLYKNLKKITNRTIAKKYQLKNVPYFYKYNNKLISQYKMSSGECLLLSLLDFINNTINKNTKNDENKIKLIIIDEIEVALHPSAIERLYNYLTDISEKQNVVVILSSHSPELIHRIKPNNLFMLELKQDRTLKITNPCYPAYAVRTVYKNDGFDYVILVEDNLAKILIRTILKKEKLNTSCLINILPVGGWENVLKMHSTMINENILGNETKIISILDGDIKKEAQKQYKNLTKLFIPIPCIEKYLSDLVNNPCKANIKKEIQDNFFQGKSIDELYKTVQPENNKNGKYFYKILIKNLKTRKITEDLFISEITKIILDYEDFSNFIAELEKLLK